MTLHLSKVNRWPNGIWYSGVGQVLYDSWDEINDACKLLGLSEYSVLDIEKHIVYHGTRILEGNGAFNWEIRDD